MKMKSSGVLVLLLLSSCLAQSAPITGVTQTWSPDATGKSGTLHIVNVSHKLITAYSISVGESQERVTDFLPVMLSVKEYGGPFRDTSNSGAFEPGGVFDEKVPLEDPTVTPVIDLVVYADGTAEVGNQKTFNNVQAMRKGRLLAAQKTTEVIQQKLADQELKDPHAAIVAELNSILSVYKKNQSDLATGYMAMIIEETISHMPGERTDLADFLKIKTSGIALLQAHSNLSEVRQ
jgi:hypothetical protein